MRDQKPKPEILVQEVHQKEDQDSDPTEKHLILMISSVLPATKFLLTSKTAIFGINLKSGEKLAMFSCQWIEIPVDIEGLVLWDFLKKVLSKTVWMIARRMGELRLKVKKLVFPRQNNDLDLVETVGTRIRGDDLKEEAAEEDIEIEVVLQEVGMAETSEETEEDTNLEEVEVHQEDEVDLLHEEADHQALWEDGTITEEMITIDGMITIEEIDAMIMIEETDDIKSRLQKSELRNSTVRSIDMIFLTCDKN